MFQVHGIDAAGQVVIGRQLTRRYVLAFFEKLPPCLVGIEARGGAAAAWPFPSEGAAGGDYCL